jgi:hypothetical protein
MAKIELVRPERKPNLDKVRFSFEYFQPDHLRFPISACPKEYFDALFREILRYQTCLIDHFRDLKNEEKRHSTHFKDTVEKEGFPDIDPQDDDLWTDDAWQFALPGVRGTPSELWRVHGFISENIFHIVWLDPLHLLCPINGERSNIRG